ncbi:hypothetical protein GWI33_008427 [Rhynchophorus ferrugineus]|uniref:Integrase catalytic domain-containing protein n=1 Tax=Rhynchophorus ferrugineus TaxID=354439 RepID=A0A834IEP8_RHYFE|nr:hypothetical protein GWI33_008427 [Rhynchophorus ferrugineus]
MPQMCRVQIQGAVFRGYLDTSSQINVANTRVAKSLNLQLVAPDTYIKGFSNRITYTKGQACLVIQINGVSVESTLHFVKTEMNNWRKSDLNQSDEEIQQDKQKDNNKTENDDQAKKHKVRTVQAVEIAPSTTAVVRVQAHTLNLVIPPKITKNYVTSTVVTADPIFEMNITNISNTTLNIGGKQTVARGYEMKERQIDEFRNYELQTIDTNETCMGEIPRKDRQRLYELLEEYNSCFATDCVFKQLKHGKKEGFLYPTRKPQMPLDTWHLDHVHPFVKSSGFAYILTIVDSYSKFCFARRTKTTNTKEVVHNLRDLFSMFGASSRIISDHGKAFKSKDFREFCIEYKIKYILNNIASPRSNGQVESYNQILLNGINTSITDEHECTGFTPHKLMCGFDKTLQADLEDSNELEINRKGDQQKATAAMNKQSQQMKKQFDRKRKQSRKYKPGDLVLWSGAMTESKQASQKKKEDHYEDYPQPSCQQGERYSAEPYEDWPQQSHRGELYHPGHQGDHPPTSCQSR